METNATNNPADQSSPSIELNKESLSYLNEIRKWTLFLSIVGFVMIGIIVLVAFFIGAIFSKMGQESQLPFPSSLLTGMYFLIAVAYFFPIFYLFKFASLAKGAIISRSSKQLDLAFMNLKSHYKFMGIMTIVVLCLYVAIAVIAGIAAVIVGR